VVLEAYPVKPKVEAAAQLVIQALAVLVELVVPLTVHPALAAVLAAAVMVEVEEAPMLAAAAVAQQDFLDKGQAVAEEVDKLLTMEEPAEVAVQAELLETMAAKPLFAATLRMLAATAALIQPQQGVVEVAVG
jgi:hypothetical protein